MQASDSRALYMVVHMSAICSGTKLVLAFWLSYLETLLKSWNPVSLLMLLSYGFVYFIGGTMSTLKKISGTNTLERQFISLYIWF
jgi:hypothetical protein